MSEHGERGRVGDIVRRDVNGLEARYRAFLGRGDPLLQPAHLGGQRGLVADLRGHPAHERRDLVAGLHESEDVIDKEQDVLAELLPEVLGEGDSGETDAEASPGRLVHLPEDHRGVPENPGLLHLAVEVVPLTRTLADPGEDARPLVLQRDVVDQLGNNDRLADPRAAEEPDLAATPDRAEQVYDLDAGHELLGLGGELGELRGRAVYRPVVLGIYGALLIDGVAEHVQKTPEHRSTHRHRDRTTRVLDLQPTAHTIRRAHRDRPHHVVTDELLDLQRNFLGLALVGRE